GTRSCAADPGPPTPPRSVPRSATGTTRSADRSSAVFAAHGMRTATDVPTPCLSGAAAHAARAVVRGAPLTARPGLGPAHATTRHGQRRRLRGRLVPPLARPLPRRGRTPALPARHAHVGRCLFRRRGPRGPH